MRLDDKDLPNTKMMLCAGLDKNPFAQFRYQNRDTGNLLCFVNKR